MSDIIETSREDGVDMRLLVKLVRYADQMCVKLYKHAAEAGDVEGQALCDAYSEFRGTKTDGLHKQGPSESSDVQPVPVSTLAGSDTEQMPLSSESTETGLRVVPPEEALPS